MEIFFLKKTTNPTPHHKPTLFLMLPKWIRQFAAGPSSLERHLKQRYNSSVTEKMKRLPGKALGGCIRGPW